MKTVQATADLVPFLLERMGPERVQVLADIAEGNPEAAVIANIESSTLTWCGIDDDGVVTMGGVCPMPDGSGYVWQFITAAISKHKRAYIEQGREMMTLGLQQYDRLVTVIEAEYTAALRHCRRNGWAVSEPTEVNGVLANICERLR